MELHEQAVEKRPSVPRFAGFPSPFVVAAYIQVLPWPTHQLIGVARCRSLFVTTPLSGFRAPPQTGFRRAQLVSACLRAAASAEAGAFLISLGKMSFSTGPEEVTPWYPLCEESKQVQSERFSILIPFPFLRLSLADATRAKNLGSCSNL
jgi:hypothetical protein